jgi:hypothetical protein
MKVNISKNYFVPFILRRDIQFQNCRHPATPHLFGARNGKMLLI